jgi:hypothetical protein
METVENKGSVRICRKDLTLPKLAMHLDNKIENYTGGELKTA